MGKVMDYNKVINVIHFVQHDIFWFRMTHSCHVFCTQYSISDVFYLFIFNIYFELLMVLFELFLRIF